MANPDTRTCWRIFSSRYFGGDYFQNRCGYFDGLSQGVE